MPSILLVEDDDQLRKMLKLLLTSSGYEVWEAGNGKGVADLYQQQHPDVVITDLHMPTHDGIWLLREFKARMPATPVILISGYLDEPGRVKLLRFGFADILMKPLPLSDLASAVARAVGR